MPKFNMNWIYVTIIIALGILFFTGGGDVNNSQSSSKGIAKTDNYFNFKTLVMKGAAKEVIVNKDENELKMYVNPEFIREVFKSDVKTTGPNPYINVEFGSVENLENFLDSAQKEGKFNGHLTYENKRDADMINTFINIASILFFVLIMVFFFRRMGGAGGGGVFSASAQRDPIWSSDLCDCIKCV